MLPVASHSDPQVKRGLRAVVCRDSRVTEVSVTKPTPTDTGAADVMAQMGNQ